MPTLIEGELDKALKQLDNKNDKLVETQNEIKKIDDQIYAVEESLSEAIADLAEKHQERKELLKRCEEMEMLNNGTKHELMMMSVKAEMKKLGESMNKDRHSRSSGKKVVTIDDEKSEKSKKEDKKEVAFEDNNSDNHISEPNEIFRFSNPTKTDVINHDCETSAVSDNELALLTDF